MKHQHAPASTERFTRPVCTHLVSAAVHVGRGPLTQQVRDQPQVVRRTLHDVLPLRNLEVQQIFIDLLIKKKKKEHGCSLSIIVHSSWMHTFHTFFQLTMLVI